MLVDVVLCFSHLRWGFVFQRPNHLMMRAARSRRVFYIEEPVFDAELAQLHTEEVAPSLVRVVPRLPQHEPDPEARVHALLRELCERERVEHAIHWYYTPMMLAVSAGLPRDLVVYDCMDELANFLFAPPELQARERELLRLADIVFTGGRALYEAKRSLHRNVHAMPSSVDVAHFRRARSVLAEPADQAAIAHPRLGYCGVVDERMDLELITGIAQRRPAWQLVMLGPVVKIDPAQLPRLPNIHYLGLKTYDELPPYLSGWDAALLPFALNDATHFISPTKTPEYLAAGKPVVSTPIRDVVEPYGRLGVVHIAAGHAAFIAAIERALAERNLELDARRDALLAEMSWDATWQRMLDQVEQAQAVRSPRAAAAELASDTHV
jgi:glycosyltransferase involved in cell wall biosynthesis